MGRTMGLGALGQDICFKRKFRWVMSIDQVAGDVDSAVSILPPQKSARPNVAFKEMQVEHLTETLYYPSKPDYKPVTITLYDLVTSTPHPVLNWINTCFDAESGDWQLSGDDDFIRDIFLTLYDGCGNTVESWVYENSWPQQVDFGDLDMGSSDIVTCDLTLRYARAYIENS